MGLKESGLRASLRSVSTEVVAIPDSVVHRWPDATGTDTIGSADLSINGATTATGSQYTEGESLEYDGVDDISSTTMGSAYEPVSLVCWTTPSVDGGSQNDFAKVMEAGDQSGSAYIQVGSNGNWYFGINDGDNRGEFDSGVSVVSGTTYQLALTTDGSTVTGYVDAVDEGSSSSGSLGASSDLGIGSRIDNSDRYAGVVDEPMVADGVLTQPEIQSLDDSYPR